MLVIQRWESTAVDWESRIHIPGREYQQHMTRVPLTLGHPARRLPLQPLAHTDNACVCVRPYVCLHVSRTATSNTTTLTLTQWGSTERGGVGKRKRRRRRRVMSRGDRTRLCHIGDPVIYWEGSFVLKGTTPSLPSHLCQTSASPCHSNLGFAFRIQRKEEEEKEREEKQSKKSGRIRKSQMKNGQRKSQMSRSERSQNRKSQKRIRFRKKSEN